ncbi:neogenin-like isoform X5 [Acanthaster planci]|uniref:Neogenin-like isoform X5 n=1 Tax=Acanthaster planci TaxID=133434 RepID=A0A8B7XT80_ACAPL|nr:neogenin-like isoform X5 [Acanthaster planci]
MAHSRTKLNWKSGYCMGISRVPLFCLVVCVLSLLSPSTLGQDVPDFNPVYFTSEPSNIIAVPGSAVTLNCSVYSLLVPTISWTKDGSAVPADDPTKRVQPSGALRIAPVSLDDEGSYQCSAELEEGDFFASLSSRRGAVTVAKLVLLDGPARTAAFNGDTVYFECNFNSVPAAEISWLKNGQVLDLTEERISARYTLLPSGGLEIREVRSADVGTYLCRGTNQLITTPVQSFGADLTINPGTNPSSQFNFIRTPQDTEAPVGQTIVLEAATNLPAIFTWFKDGSEIIIVGSGTEDHYTLLGQGSLEIRQIGEIDTGLYRVLATSIADGTALPVDHTVKVTALVPLKFNIQPVNTYTNVGSSVTLNCNAYGIPGPTTTWYKEGEELEPGDIYLVSAGSLTIEQVIQEDSGIYQCVADNRLENIQAAAELIVLREGVPIPTRPPTTTVTTLPAPPQPITTKSPPGPADTGPVPTKPLELEATDIQAQSFRLTWREPSQLNGDLQSYRIYVKWNDAQKVEIVRDLSQLAKVISDLIPETTYRVTILAINENGAGASSDILVVETLPHGEYLGPPTSVRARPEEGSCTALLVTWQAPQGDVLNYKVYYADLSAGVSQELELYTEQNFYLITGLKPYTNYGLRVVGYNINGPGTSSENLEASTSQCKPSGIPDNISAEADSTTSITVTWEPPPVNQRNGLVNGYKMKYRTKENGKRTHSLIIDGNERSYTISGLVRNTAYEVRMAAYNNNGTGPYSDWIEITTLDIDKNENRVPPQPLSIRTTTTHNRIDVFWEPPSDDSIMVRGYILGYGASVPDSLLERLPSSETQVSLTNLLPSTLYVLKLRAFNKVGEGPSLYIDVQTKQPTIGPSPTRIIHVTTRTAKPSVPMELKATVTSPNSILLTWRDQDYSPDDKPPDRYYIVQYETSSKVMFENSSDTSIAINNLSPYTKYFFTVVAVSGNRESGVSMQAFNTTFETAPTSPPRSLTIDDVKNSTTTLELRWQLPKTPNGQITGYTIYYSAIDSREDSDWTDVTLDGEEVTTLISGLTSGTIYYFKIQAHTSKGAGPISEVVSHTTPVGRPVEPGPLNPEPTSPPPLANAEAMGFPWWLWLVIILAILFIIIIAVLLLLCFLCGCCACCADCCPCCAALCEDACGCCAPFCGPLAACIAACCPCCCEDEDDCAKCWLKCCCGAAACVCCGHSYRERRKAKGSANLVGYQSVSQNGKVSGTVPPDLWINHEGVEMKKVDGKKGGIAVNSKAEERERLEQGGGVDQQRDQVQETSFTQSSVQNQQESRMQECMEEQTGSSNRQSQYETPTLISATSHRSSLESDLHVGGTGSGAVHYATVDEMRRKKSSLKETRQEAANWGSIGKANPRPLTPNPEASLFGPQVPPPYQRIGCIKRGQRPNFTEQDANTDTIPLGSSAEDFARQRAPSITISPPQTQTQTLNRSEVQNRAAGGTTPRYATWGAKTIQNDRQQSNVNYNTTNIHVEDVRNNYTANDGFSTLRDGGYQGSMGANGQTYSTLDRQTSYNNAHSGQNQIITFPEQNAGPQPFTITFEETTTSHSVEKSVPLPDGTSFKTSSSHQTFSKSYSTSDAAQDQNLQAMLQGGIENGPLAIEIPSTTNTALPAIAAAPVYRSASFNPIPQDSPSTGTQSSSISNTLGRSPPPPNYNFITSENASAQTQSSGYASGSISANNRGRTSSIGASSVDSMGYRSRGADSYLSTQDQRSNFGTTSPVSIPAASTSPYSSNFQTYESYRSEERDNSYGRSASDLYDGSPEIGVTRPKAGFHTIDRSTGFNADSAYGSPTSFGNGFGSYGGASTLGKQPSGSLSVPSARPGHSYQASAFQNTSESFRSYNSGNVGTRGTSQFSFNNNNASTEELPSRLVEVEHAEVQTPSRFNSKSDLLQSTSSSLGGGFDLSTPTRPLRRSMSVDNEFGLNNDGYWSGSSKTNLLSGYQTQRETKESKEYSLSSGTETQRGRSRHIGDRTYGGISSRSRSLDRFGDREDHHVSPVGGYDYHSSTPRQHQMDRPAYMYPTNTTSSGYHSDTNTTSSHDDGSSTQGSTSRGGNPLTSFSVPGPPPNYQAAKVKIQAPAYSPLKRNQQAGVARVRHQPLPVVTPRAPDVTYRGVGDGTSPGTANRSFSSEDLNTEMLNLEGLMKDLNAITASELQS